MHGKSPQKATDQVLGAFSVEESNKFLLECLNLPTPIDYPEHRPHFERWLRRWQKLFTFHVEEDGKWRTKLITREQLERFAPNVRTALRRIWDERDTRQRDWYFYRIRDEYNRMILRAENPDLLDLTEANAVQGLLELERESRARSDDPSQRVRFLETRAAGADILDDVPRICPFEAAVYWLQVNQKLMVYCEGPTCAAPYFFREEKGQKYCSPECADPARREAKLRWWNENKKNPGKRSRKRG
jgi:hypothetical protein